MPYVTARDIKADALFRAGEPSGGGQWNDKAIDYLNRSYRALATGASEFLPEYVEDWWWTRGRGVLTLDPAYTAGTVQITEGDTAIIFSDPPEGSAAGYKLRIDGWGEVFGIESHVGNQPDAVLDSPYTGDSNSAATFKLMRTDYDLVEAVSAVTSPMVGFRNNPSIVGLSPERLDELYPPGCLNTGIPTAFSLEDVRTVRFSHGGRSDGKSMRIEYKYRKTVDTLIDSDSSVPIVPLEYRHILADMTLTFLYMDKNDDRSNAVALAARTALAAMLKDNRRRLNKMGSGTIGQIFPRQGSVYNDGPPRTESGLIIGGPY